MFVSTVLRVPSRRVFVVIRIESRMAEGDHEYVLVSAADAHVGFEENLYPPREAFDSIWACGRLTQLAEPPDVRAKIQEWLAPSEYASESSDFKKHLRSYVPKTGDWLRKSEACTQWHEQGETALWVNGTPGSGKSVVAATLVSDFAKSDDIPVLYFFFRHPNLANRNPQQLTRDWLSQVLDRSSLVQLLLKDLLKKTS